MAKKIRRNIPNSSPVVSTTPAATAAPAAVTRPGTGFASSRPSYSTEFKPDYSLVVSDLKRIAVLASFFAMVLIVLSFFLR
jgi:hypothetical protein